MFHERDEVHNLSQKSSGPDVARQDVRVALQESVRVETRREAPQVIPPKDLATPRGIARVTAELHAVHGVDLEAEELQRKDGGLVAHVAVRDVALDGEDARLSLF